MRGEERAECRWVSVVDATGGCRLEMRWHLPVVPTQAETVSRQARAVAPPTLIARAA